jgi:hypothetical protein
MASPTFRNRVALAALLVLTTLVAAWFFWRSRPPVPPASAPELAYTVIPADELPRDDLSPVARRLLRDPGTMVAGRSPAFHALAPNIRHLSLTLNEAEFAWTWMHRWIEPPAATNRALIVLVADAVRWNDLVRGHGLRHDSLAMQLQRELYLKDDPVQNARADRIAHEVVHLRLNDPSRRPVPLWLEEGLAGHLGWRCALDYQATRRVRLFRTVPAVEPAHLLPLDRLLAVNAYPADPVAARAFYRQTEELVALVHEQQGDDGLRRLIDRSPSIGVDPVAWFRETSGLDEDALAAFETTWLERSRQPQP